MKFYDIDSALNDEINRADKPVRLKIEIQMAGHFQSVFEQDIIEANFYGLKETAGGVSSRGEILIDNSCGFFSDCGGQRTISNEQGAMSNGVGKEVRVSFSMGEGLSYFQRFRFYVDDRGIQHILGNGRKRCVFIGVRDLSAKLRKSNEARDWSSPVVFTYSVVCDKTMPEKSLVHCIAQRAGLGVSDIDCSTIPVTLPYVKLRRNIWAELSCMAAAYRCHLECPVEKPLVFAHSPYQSNDQLTMNNEQNNENTYLIKGEDIFYFRKIARAELYRNTVRLKINMPVSLEKQEIWRYDDPPVMYDEFFQPHYPFKYPLVREIENGNYEAKYHVTDANGKERNVVFADKIDTKEEAENRLDADGGGFCYTHYDVTSNHDRAILTLQKENDGDLYKAAIFGRPIVIDLNRSCYMRDVEAVEAYGTAALNVTGNYFSEYEIYRNGLPLMQYEDWVVRELAERMQDRRDFTVKTHRALFNARVGANVKITLKNEQLAGKINAFSFRYKKDGAFIASFRIREK